jgi:hypothetical protein
VTVYLLTACDDVMVFDDAGTAEMTQMAAIGANLDAELIPTTAERWEAARDRLRVTDYRTAAEP